MATDTRSRGASEIIRVVLHVLGVLFASYALTALLVATVGAVLSRLGMVRSEAVVLAAILGFLVYLVLLLWAFSVTSVLRLWTILALVAGAAASLLYFLR